MKTCMAIIMQAKTIQSVVFRLNGLSCKCIQVKVVNTIMPLEKAKNLDGHRASEAS